MNFTAIDFETSQGKKYSICQVGLIRVEGGVVTDEVNLLVKPPHNFYWDKFIDIHGITPEMTKNQPNFAQIWDEIAQYIEGQKVVAHNGLAFDFHCIDEALAYYEINKPEYIKHDTYRIYKKSLGTLCDEHHISLNHHDALSDARACALLFIKHLKNQHG